MEITRWKKSNETCKSISLFLVLIHTFISPYCMASRAHRLYYTISFDWGVVRVVTTKKAEKSSLLSHCFSFETFDSPYSTASKAHRLYYHNNFAKFWLRTSGEQSLSQKAEKSSLCTFILSFESHLTVHTVPKLIGFTTSIISPSFDWGVVRIVTTKKAEKSSLLSHCWVRSSV